LFSGKPQGKKKKHHQNKNIESCQSPCKDLKTKTIKTEDRSHRLLAHSWYEGQRSIPCYMN